MRTTARLVFTITALAAAVASAQTIVEPTDRARFNSLFDGFDGERLKCKVQSIEPSIDFGFRFELRYSVDCEVKQFGGTTGVLNAFLRVRPETGPAIMLGDQFAIPAAPETVQVDSLHRLRSVVEFSGALAAGAGVYNLELLLIDNHDRVYRHHWTAKALGGRREVASHFSMPANTLAPLQTTPIPIRATRNGGGLTVLINAAPLNPRSRKLRAWDRAFLLDSLSSLLRQLPYSSVRVVAFNLEQQREIFRQDNFSESDMRKLAGTLRRLELGVVPYSTLERKQGWAELLLGLLKREAQEERPANAVVFLGPTLRLEEKVPPPLLASYPKQTLPLFCVAYYPRIGADFPDSIQHLTAALKGKVFRVHSPSELAQNLEKLQHEMQMDKGASARRLK